MHNQSIEIIPAILPKSLSGIEHGLERVRDAAPLVQIDIIDGVFAPDTTWPYTDRDSFERILAEEEGLPFWEEFDFEFDLMINNPQEEAEKYIRAGASRIVLHAASRGAVEAATALALQNDANSPFAFELGIALALDQGAEALVPFGDSFDFVQVMGIDPVGRQGAPFDERALSLIAAVRAQLGEHADVCPIQVDGGVRVENAAALVAAGATRLVAGSAIFGTNDAARAIATLRKATQSA